MKEKKCYQCQETKSLLSANEKWESRELRVTAGAGGFWKTVITLCSDCAKDFDVKNSNMKLQKGE